MARRRKGFIVRFPLERRFGSNQRVGGDDHIATVTILPVVRIERHEQPTLDRRDDTEGSA